MFKKKRTVLLDIWKQMWIAALILYGSYFFYRWIGVFVANIIGEISDVLLYQDNKVLDSILLGKLILAFSLALLIMPLIDLITNVLVFRRGLKYEKSVVQSVFRKRYETIQKWRSSEWIGRISKDSIQYRQMAVVTPTRIAADGTVLLIAVVSLLKINILMTVVFMIGLLLSTGLHLLYREKSNVFLKETRDYQSQKRQFQIEMVQGHSFWKSFDCEKAIPQRMNTLYQNFWIDTQEKDILLTAKLDLFPKAIISALFLFSLFYGLNQVTRGSMRAGDYVAVYFLVLQIRTMLESILSNIQIMRGYGAQKQRIIELLQDETQDGKTQVDNWQSLHFECVSYIYPESQNGMHERDFKINRGELVEIEGENGSGKTTLLKLISGLFSSKNQQVKLDAMPLSELDLCQWRNKIGYMQQFPDVLPGSVRENVHIGNLAATDTQVDETLKTVGLTELASRQLSGLKNELSGGEIKKIELARILMRLDQCDLIILDEPYENLDEAGRNLVDGVLKLPGTARVLISHSKRS